MAHAPVIAPDHQVNGAGAGRMLGRVGLTGSTGSRHEKQRATKRYGRRTKKPRKTTLAKGSLVSRRIPNRWPSKRPGETWRHPLIRSGFGVVKEMFLHRWNP